MSSISSISSSNLYKNYQQLSSGKRINSAADDAAGLAIAEKLTSQRNGYDVGNRNAAASQDMLKVADGALGSITDSLQRIRELSLQASNTAIYGDDELGAIQQEIDHLKQMISDTASQTQFNEKKLLDGSLKNSHTASNPDGSGMELSISDSTLAALGIADYDVTGDFDISVIDEALNKVSSARSSIGASSNALDHTMNFNSYASYNLTASKSRIEDLDFGKAVSDQKKNEVLKTYQIMMQRNIQENRYGRVVRLFHANGF